MIVILKQAILKMLLFDEKWVIGAVQMPIIPKKYNLIDGFVSC